MTEEYVVPHYGRHDPAARRLSQRHGRERGCWVYIPAEALLAAGINPLNPRPAYRVWPGKRGSVAITLYREQ